ncbi:MAG TPA: hypothetical protein ENN41_05880 [Sediminispirochaeta sp.]|nr:hypothetical protein [Sediminispirochaeta sp.]
MERDELYRLVDAILNKASFDELEVLKAAIARREGEGEGRAIGGLRMSPKKLAESTAQQLADQISYSRDSIREMIQDFAVDIIRKEAPELSDEQVYELLEAWIPDEGARSASDADDESETNIPKDALLTMIEQFLLYSQGRMSVRQQSELRREIPNWHQVYWEKFPSWLRRSLSLFLKGTIDKESFWLDVYKNLDL